MNITIYKSFSRSLHQTWKELEKNIELSVFQQFDWQKNWFKYIGEKQNYKLNIIIIEDKNSNKVILPFCVKNKFGFKVLSFLGGNQTDYNSVIYSKIISKIENKTIIWDQIQNQLEDFDFIELRNLINYKKYEFLFPKQKLRSNISEISNYTLLESSWEKQKLKIRKKLLQDTLRQIKRLKKLGRLEFEIVNYTDKNFNMMIDIFFKQKENRYRSTGALNNFSFPEVKNFYKNTTQLLGSNISIQFSVLKLNDQVIATHWGAYNKTSFYYLMPAYSSKWGKYSPGKILLEYLIKWSIKKNLSIFDFTIGSERYKKEWCEKETFLNNYYYANGFKGLIYFKIKLIKEYLIKITLFAKTFKLIRKFKNLLTR